MGLEQPREDLASSVATAELQRHLEDAVRLWVGMPRDSGIMLPGMPEHLQRLFLRREEYADRPRDLWGCWEHSYSDNYREGKLWEPEVDQWTAGIRRELAKRTELTPLWPRGHGFVLCLTHDVDTISHQRSLPQILRQFQVDLRTDGRTARPVMRRLLQAAARSLYWSVRRHARSPSAELLERCVAVEKEMGVASSYFFTVYPLVTPAPYDCVYAPSDKCLFRGAVRSVADIMKGLADDGFDVGLHGSYNSALNRTILEAEKTTLEKATGLRISTTRQHWLHWDVRTTPAVQEAVGLRADSTLGFNRNVGFRCGTALPFYAFDLEANRELDVLEVPLILQDGALTASNALELDVDMAKEVGFKILGRIKETGGVGTILFHPHTAAVPEYLELYRTFVRHGLEQGAWVTSLAAVNDWWRRRAAILAKSDD